MHDVGCTPPSSEAKRDGHTVVGLGCRLDTGHLLKELHRRLRERGQVNGTSDGHVHDL